MRVLCNKLNIGGYFIKALAINELMTGRKLIRLHNSLSYFSYTDTFKHAADNLFNLLEKLTVKACSIKKIKN